MKIILQIGILLGICLAGELIAMVLPVPIPGSVLSMALVFVLLLSGLLKAEHIKEKTNFLMKNMAYFFIPAGVGILEHFETLKGSILPLLIICLITTVLTFAATAFTVRGVMALQERVGKRRDK